MKDVTYIQICSCSSVAQLEPIDKDVQCACVNLALARFLRPLCKDLALGPLIHYGWKVWGGEGGVVR